MNLISTKILDSIFFNPVKLGADRLLILSGYASPNMASWLIEQYMKVTDKKITINLIVGMVYSEGISVSVHEGFKELTRETQQIGKVSFKCSYIYKSPASHTNLYIWYTGDSVLCAFLGSAPFTQPALLSGRKESFVECNNDDAIEAFNNAESNSVFCDYAEIEECVRIYQTHPVFDLENKLINDIKHTNLQCVKLSLLSRTGEPGRKSGLNWGHRKGRNHNEAYIPLPVKIARSGFFPLKGEHFTTVTDDGCLLILRVEQENDKAITTPSSNALLGEYFRKRLGVGNGDLITRADLNIYGRWDVTFLKIDDEQYYLDFSV